MKHFMVICVLFSLAVFANGFPAEEVSDLFVTDDINLLPTGLPISDDLIKCVKDALEDIIRNNRDLDWWFEDIKNTALNLLEEARKCAVASGIKQELCLLKLKGTLEKEVRRIVNDLPEEKKGLVENVKDIIQKCIP